ncbi:conserved Plasmodium protein, unknown function [Plasmodium chabaudi chabaudi]|uniref:Dynein regulatory complex protein 1 C-terminal domain-containing protein n=1 Tax=Plasmodium chabaudi chabaudi TaxID=31271 RepID=A0A4V0K2P1_PLACU|nr:conserved Plasmodium protein, unknown function [Plasmodium chabaudi chabaudi]VTZ66730.1 conserved Plasmodium protein, unknown function [Plasmodium chabaudi chabaudi]|eukprot:XP_016655675.1 conserved Plasmodium protein, unknown function [Plasmodium chabaudi chabaudi]
MDTLTNISKERRIEIRRNRIQKKLPVPEKTSKETTHPEAHQYQLDTQSNEKNENNIKQIFEYKQNEININDDNASINIINHVNEEKNKLLHNVITEVNTEKKSFIDNVQKYAIDVKDSNDIPFQKYNNEILLENEGAYKSKFQNNFADVKNLALKEKETYEKKIEKYFSLLKYKDEQIKKVCKNNSQNILSLVSVIQNQRDGYKMYLENLLNKTRDELNYKRKNMLKENKQILDDLIRIQSMNSTTFIDELNDIKSFNQKIKDIHEENNLKLKTKIQLEENLNMDMQSILDINNIIMDKEKKLYNIKVLQQKNNHNLKKINFYKLEINKLRESLISIKTYYYNYKIKSKKIVNELINQYERIKFQFIELQKRQKSYEKFFQKKYATAWNLQKNEANAYIEKLIDANKIIYEQIFFKEFYHTNYKHFLEETSAFPSTTTKVKDGNKKTSISVQSVTAEQIENIKRLILDECGFLVDENLDDQDKLNKLLNYIGVHTEEDIELLTKLFYTDNTQNNKDHETTEMVSTPEYALDIIFKYYQEKEKENACQISNKKKKYINRLNSSLKLIIERKKQEKRYWDNLAQITPDDMIDLWKIFLVFVEDYYHILKERATIVQSIFKEEKMMKDNMKKINKMMEYT